MYTGKGDWITHDPLKPSNQAGKLIICGFYLFLGLSLLAMCLELMKEEVRANILWISHRTKPMNWRAAQKNIANEQQTPNTEH